MDETRTASKVRKRERKTYPLENMALGFERLSQTAAELHISAPMGAPKKNVDGVNGIGRIRGYKCRLCSHEWISANRKNCRSVPNRCPNCRSMMWNCQKVYEHKCVRCEYSWKSSQSDSPRCPECHSAKWNLPPEICCCKMCGYSWEKRISEPRRCPSCGTSHWNSESITHRCISCGTEYPVRTNVCGRCPSCGTRFYNCRCAECGCRWNDISGNRPSECPQCDSEQWQHTYKDNTNCNAPACDIHKADADVLRGELDIDPECADVLDLLYQKKKPIEIAIITGKSYDRIMAIREKLALYAADMEELTA